MTDFAPINIKRIRWLQCDKEVARLYRFSQPIMYDGHTREHMTSSKAQSSALTEQGLRLVNKLISQVGVASVDAYCHELFVTIYPIFEWGDGYHDFILEAINWTLFDNRATVFDPETRPAA